MKLMKQNGIFQAGLFGLLATFAACTAEDPLTGRDDTTLEGESSLRRIEMTVEDFVWSGTDTRVNVDATTDPNNVKFTWSESDVIGVLPQEGFQAKFKVASGQTTGKSVVFDGGGWRVRKTDTYSAYFPFSKSVDMSQKTFVASYAGQKQVGNASTAHLNSYQYLVAPATAQEGEAINFLFKHVDCLMKLDLTVPEAAEFRQLSLSAPTDVFATDGTVNFSSADANLTLGTKTNTFTLDLQDITTTAPGEVITLYMMLPPLDLTGTDALVTLTNAAGKTYTAQLGQMSKVMQKGKAYKRALTLKKIEVDYTPECSGSSDQYRISSITMAGQTISLNSTDRYVDLSSQSFTVNANTDITCTFNTDGTWTDGRHGYIYIDKDNDGFTAAIWNGYTPAEDLVAYSVYSINGRQWRNMTGNYVWDYPLNPPMFKTPSTPGTYRMRWKVDYCNVNPSGGKDPYNGFNYTVDSVNGTIIDVTLVVE